MGCVAPSLRFIYGGWQTSRAPTHQKKAFDATQANGELMRFPRASGVLLHVSCLPGRFGIGDLGEQAYEFVDFLQRSGQRIWQILPLEPPGVGASPYNCYSAFAGNPLLISPTQLVRLGWLPEAELRACGEDAEVDFPAVYESKGELLSKSFDYFHARASSQHRDEYRAFRESNQYWLDDFALFAAVVESSGTGDWTAWDPDLVVRKESALSHWRTQLGQQIDLTTFQQFVFYHQLRSLKSYANQRGVRLFGDMPIFVAHASADVWSNQELFCLAKDGQPAAVAGVPPDYFSKTGQLWGNPLFRWDAIAATGYDWWLRRLEHALARFDMLRIDHFRGFESYWRVTAPADTAVDGEWVKGPGRGVFDAASHRFGDLPIVAEDLGLITDDVHALRDELGFPGMRVLQFGFDNVHDSYHRPEAYPEHCVAYTGTHDNDTIMGWYQQRRVERGTDDLLFSYLTGAEVHRDLIRLVLESRADTAIIPMQDILGLPSSARMNTPGEADGNWKWRCPAVALSEETAHFMRELASNSGRVES